MKPILPPLPVTVAQGPSMAISPWRLCIPHLHHHQLPPEDPFYATRCHTLSSDDSHGPEQCTEHGISRSFLWKDQLCATSYPSKHHCRGQASRASPSACSSQSCLQGSPLLYLVASSLVQEQVNVGQITWTFHVSFNGLSNDVDNISVTVRLSLLF